MSVLNDWNNNAVNLPLIQFCLVYTQMLLFKAICI